MDKDRVHVMKDGVRKYYSCGHAGMGTRQEWMGQKIRLWGLRIRAGESGDNPNGEEMGSGERDDVGCL